MTALSGLFSSTTITMCAGTGIDCAAATGAGPALTSAQITVNVAPQRFMQRSLGAGWPRTAQARRSRTIVVGMSVKVDLNQLADALSDFAFAYLVTVGDDFRAHTVAVDPVYADGLLDVGEIGRHTRANVTAHSDVTVIWPPREPGGYTLIVDGTAQAGQSAPDVAAGAAPTLRITPTRAVLHRKATAESPSTSPDCLHDCVPLEG